jgi:hypothetical protein
VRVARSRAPVLQNQSSPNTKTICASTWGLVTKACSFGEAKQISSVRIASRVGTRAVMFICSLG